MIYNTCEIAGAVLNITLIWYGLKVACSLITYQTPTPMYHLIPYTHPSPPSIPHLSPPHLLLHLQTPLLHLPPNLLLTLNRTLASPQSNEPPNLPPLCLQRQPLSPGYRTRIVFAVDTRAALVVEVRQLIQLLRSEQPEIEERRREVGTDVAGGDADERHEREGHLLDFALESRIRRARREDGCWRHDFRLCCVL